MMTKALALNGADKVYIIGRRLEKLEEAVKESPHNNIIPIQGDVTDKASLQSIAERIRKEAGYINLLICNSGISGPQAGVNMPKETSAKELAKMVLDTPMEEFNNVFAVNVTGVLYNAMAFLELLEEGNKPDKCLAGVKSQVLVTGSIAAYNRLVGAGLAYNTSKAAVTHLVKMLAGLLVEYSVRVNAIAPGCTYLRIALGKFQQANHGHSIPIAALGTFVTGKGRDKGRSLPQEFYSAPKDRR